MSNATHKAMAGVPLKLASRDDIFARMNEVHAAISQRAYEIFEGQGASHGHDLDDWLQAESELLRPAAIEVTESANGVAVQAELSGYSAHALKISVEPRRLVICGRKESKENHKGKKVARREEILRVVELPAEVDPERTTATLNDARLKVQMPKTEPARKGGAAPIS
jgi:HSP20 family protein